MSAARIANAICQDASFKGVYLLLEGKRDMQVYRRFLGGSWVRARLTWGKYKQREVYRLLAERNFSNVVAIRDADFLRVKGNPKFSADYSDAIFPTDFHDLEIMMLNGGVLSDFLNQVSDEEKVDAFQKKVGSSIIDLLQSLCYPVGCLRLANKRHQLRLSFKPDRPDGKSLKFHKFISLPDWTLDREKMVNTVWEYSRNRGAEVAPKATIEDRLSETLLEQHPVWEIINGHDLAAALFEISTVGLKSTNKLLQDPGCVEQLLGALYDLRKFSSTVLYSNISKWSSSASVPPIFAPL